MTVHVQKIGNRYSSTTAQDIDKAFHGLAQGGAFAFRQRMINQLKNGEDVRFTKPAAIIAARKDQTLVLRDNADGSVSVVAVKGEFEPDAGDVRQRHEAALRVVNTLLERDDIDKVPIPPAAKRYARRHGLAAMQRQPTEFLAVNAELTNPGKKDHFQNYNAVGKVPHAMKA